MKYADLHTHSTMSDGAKSPAKVVEAAARAGLRAVALTDHDTIDGVAEAKEAGARLGIEVIAGVEISTRIGETSVHILAYLMETGDTDFRLLLGENLTARRERMVRMVKKLNDLGYAIDLDDTLEYMNEAVVGRALLAKYMVEKGHFSSMNQAFEVALGDGKPAYEPAPRISPSEAIRVVEKAGGVTSLAHPGYTSVDEMIPELVAAGLDGIEVYSPQHTEDDRRRYRALAERYGLLITGGSDWHGVGAGGRKIGVVAVNQQEYARLVERAAGRRRALAG